MKYKKYSFISAILLVISLIFLLGAISYHYYKIYQKSRPESGEVTRAGQITNINQADKSISLDWGENNLEKLIVNDQSKMILPPDVNQAELDLDQLKINDNVSIKFDAKKKIIVLLIRIGSNNLARSLIKGKITALNSTTLELKTLETNSQALIYNQESLSSLEVIDKTGEQDNKINYSNLAKNDDVIIELDKDNNIKKINLIKVGPR